MTQRIDNARAHGAVVGHSFAEDAGRRLTVTIDVDRRGPASFRHDIHLTAEDGTVRTVYFDVESPFPVAPPTLADSALLVGVFPGLMRGGHVHVEGDVSARLVRNVLEIQAVWIKARPDLYRPFSVSADRVLADVSRSPSTQGLMTLSGGLDSMTTLFRHTDPERPLGDATVELGACLFIPGFSPRASRKDEYPAAIEVVRRVAALRGLELIVCETNFGDVVRAQPDGNGTLVGAALTLFASRFRIGLIASNLEHLNWEYPYFGLSAAYDPLFSSGAFEVRDDGGALEREEKAALIGRYPEALEHLIVCFEMPGFTSNCCRCEKCIRTMLNFIAVGAEIPPAFSRPFPMDRIGKRLVAYERLAFGRVTLRTARALGIKHPAIRKFRREYLRKRIGYSIRYAATWALPWTDFLYRDHLVPRWLVARRHRAVLRARTFDEGSV